MMTLTSQLQQQLHNNNDNNYYDNHNLLTVYIFCNAALSLFFSARSDNRPFFDVYKLIFCSSSKSISS